LKEKEKKNFEKNEVGPVFGICFVGGGGQWEGLLS